MFITATERALIKRGVEDGGRKVINYVPNNFHQAPRLLIDEIGIDTFVCTVSPMDRHGYFSFGTGNDYSTKVARAAKRLIVEVNENMPRVIGAGAELHVSEVDAIVENHVPLLELPVRAPTPEDEVIGRTIAGLVPDGACLQMGVGALPNLVCAELEGPQRSRHPYRGAEPRPGRSDPRRRGDQPAQERSTAARPSSPSRWGRRRCTTS